MVASRTVIGVSGSVDTLGVMVSTLSKNEMDFVVAGVARTLATRARMRTVDFMVKSFDFE